MATTQGLYTTNRTYVGMLRGTYATVAYDNVGPTYVSDSAFRFNSLLLTGETDYVAFNADNSLNNFNVTISGDTKAANFNPYTPGYYSNYFDGTGDYLTTPNIGSITGDFTIEGWFYSEIPTNTWYPYFFGSNSPWTVGGGIGLYYSTQTTVAAATAVYVTCSGSGFQVCTFADIQNRWCHIALVRSGSTLTVYLDGVSKGTMTASGTIATTTFLINGTDEGGSFDNHASKGYISNFRIIKGTALYTSAFTPPTSPLTAVSGTALLTCQSNSLIDKSTNAYTITKNGDSKVVAANPFSVPTTYASYGSAYFDGTGDYMIIPSSSTFGLGTGDFTIEFWAYSMSSARQDWVDISDGSNRVLVYYSSTAVSVYTVPPNSGIITGAALTLNTWNHYAVTKSAGNTKLFVNGIQAGSTYTTNQNYGTTASVNIGRDQFGSTYATGYISDLRIVKGTAVYTGNFTPPTAPVSIAGSSSQYSVTANVNTTFPFSNTLVLTTQTSQPHNNNAFIDKSIFAQLITRNGNPYSGTFSPYGPNWSGYFDGASYIITATSTAFGFGTGDYTVEFWYYSADDSYSYPWDFRAVGGGANQTKPLMSIDATNTIFYIGTSAKITTTGVPNRTWTHVALVRQTGVTKIYLNGVLTGTPYTGSEDFGSTNTLALSTVADSPGYSTTELLGNMSNFRVVKGVAVYTGNFTPSTVALTTTVTAAANVTAVSSANVSYLGLNSYNLADTSNNKISQTITGTVLTQRFSPFAPTANASPVYSAGSIYLDGTGDYLDFPASNPVLKMGTGDFTIEFWVYPTTAPNSNWSPFFSIGTSGGGQEIRISQNINNTGFGYLIPNNTNNGDTYVGFGTLPINQWSHLALVRTGSTVTFYRNGLIVGTTTSVSFAHNNSTICRIGYPQPAYSGTDGSFAGYISDVRVVNNAVYTGNCVPPSLPLTLSGNSAIYSNTTNVNTTFSISNTKVLLNFTDAAIKDSTTYVNLETVGDAKLGFETAYSGSYYSNYFDGSGDYLTVPAGTAAMGTGDFSVELWVYHTTSGTLAGYYYQGEGGPGGGINFRKTAADKLELSHDAVQNVVTSTASIPINQWVHVAVTRSSGTVRLFINGVVDGSVTYAGNFTGTTGLQNIGTVLSNNYFLTGYISNFRVVKGAAVYTGNFTPPTAPLTAISGTEILTCQSNRFIDNSGNNRTITKNGETAVKSFNPFQRNTGSSLFFDGSGDYLQIASSTQEVIGAANATVEFWMYPIQTDSYRRLITTTSGGFSSGTFVIRFNNGNFLAGAGGGNYITATTPAANTWTHVAWVGNNNGSTQTLYLNGNVAGTSTTYNLTEAIQFVGGYYTTGPAEFFYGYIDDLRVTKGNVRYTANFIPSTNMLQVR